MSNTDDRSDYRKALDLPDGYTVHQADRSEADRRYDALVIETHDEPGYYHVGWAVYDAETGAEVAEGDSDTNNVTDAWGDVEAWIEAQS